MILNFDIDALYSGGQNNVYNLSKSQFNDLIEKLEWYIHNAEVVTIALSPECCGGWQNCLNTFFEIDKRLKLGFDQIKI